MRRTHWLALALVLVAMGLRAMMVTYSLPDREHLDLHFSARKPSDVSAERLNLYRVMKTSYADEVDVIGSISTMKPSRFDFNPHHHFWGHFHFYVLSFFYLLSHVAHLVTLVPTKHYYFEHPEQMARMFMVGRAVSVAMAGASVLLMYGIGKTLWDKRVGLIAALLLALLPIHVFMSQFMVFDVPMMFWMLLSVWFGSLYFEMGQRRYFYCAMTAAALATGTKYHGVLCLIPVFYLFITQRKTKSALDWKTSALGLFLMMGAFVATNPYLLIDWQGVKQQVFQDSIYRKTLDNASVQDFLPRFIENLRVYFPRKQFQMWGVGAGLCVVPLFVVGTFASLRKALPFAATAVALVLLDATLSYHVLRQVMVAAVWAIPIIAVGFSGMIARWRWMGLMCAVCLLAMFLEDARFIAMRLEPFSDDAIGMWVQKNIAPGSSIGVLDVMTAPPIDSDRYELTDLKHGHFSETRPEFVVIYQNDERRDLERELAPNYEDIAHVGRYPAGQDRPGWRRPAYPELGEYQGFQNRYVVYKRR